MSITSGEWKILLQMTIDPTYQNYYRELHKKGHRPKTPNAHRLMKGPQTGSICRWVSLTKGQQCWGRDEGNGSISHKLPATKWGTRRERDLICRTVTMVHNNILYIWDLLNTQLFLPITKKPKVTTHEVMDILCFKKLEVVVISRCMNVKTALYVFTMGHDLAVRLQ